MPNRRSGVGPGTKIFVALAALTVAAAAGFVIATRFVGNDKTAKPAAPPEPVATVAPAPTPPVIDAATVAIVEVDASPSPAEIEPAPPAGSGSAKPTKPAKPSAKTVHTTSATTSPADAMTAEPADAAPAPAADCDQASCEAAHYEPACCAQFKPAETAATTESGLPETLDRAMVKTAIERMKPIVIQCGEKSGAKGTVKLAVTVSADGVVQDISVAESPDASLGECVASAIRKAKFAKTATGASFTYPFVF
jgi:TonB family protein